MKRSTVFAPDPWPRPGLTAFFPAPSGVFAGSPYPRDCGIESVIQPFVIGPLDQLEVGIVPLAPRSIFTVPLGFGCTAIPAGEEVTFACTVASPTQIIRWVIPSSVAFQLLVTEMTVGRDRILVCEPVPAAIFVEDAAVPEIMNDSIANGGQTISITLKNITPVAIEVVCVGAIARVLSS